MTLVASRASSTPPASSDLLHGVLLTQYGLRFMRTGLRFTAYGLRNTVHGLTGYGLRNPGYSSWITIYVSRNTVYGLRNTADGLRFTVLGRVRGGAVREYGLRSTVQGRVRGGSVNDGIEGLGWTVRRAAPRRSRSRTPTPPSTTRPPVAGIAFECVFFSASLLASLDWSNTQVYETYIRALLETTVF